ncbi:MAG: hypothetical protein M1835_001070 [Candelina submexicana]|nr:MAG: hypothetical protein M1835_001070 [Candelina submexicana]
MLLPGASPDENCVIAVDEANTLIKDIRNTDTSRAAFGNLISVLGDIMLQSQIFSFVAGTVVQPVIDTTKSCDTRVYTIYLCMRFSRPSSPNLGWGHHTKLIFKDYLQEHQENIEAWEDIKHLDSKATTLITVGITTWKLSPPSNLLNHGELLGTAATQFSDIYAVLAPLLSPVLAHRSDTNLADEDSLMEVLDPQLVELIKCQQRNGGCKGDQDFLNRIDLADLSGEVGKDFIQQVDL